MKGIILAAGEGKRLRPLTENLPKTMIDFFGVTLLQRQIETMRKCNVTDIIVVTGYMSEKINIPGVKYVQNENYDTTNMVETLFCARNELEGDLIISYGDIIFQINILEKLINSDDDISIVVDKNWKEYWKKRFNNPLDDAESLKIDEQGNIVNIGQNAENILEIQGQYIGLMKFNENGTKILRDFYDYAKKESCTTNILNPKLPFKNSYMTDILQGLITYGHKLKAVMISSGWLEFDSISDYNIYQEFHKQNILNELIDLER